MEVTCYLVIQGRKINNWTNSRRPGTVSVKRNRPALKCDEIAVKFVLSLPEGIFERVLPEAVIAVPEDAVLAPEVSVAVLLEDDRDD